MLSLIFAALLAQLSHHAEVQYVSLQGLVYAPAHGQAGKLDLYAPGDATAAPVAIYVHGGAWYKGDRSDYGFLGRALARQGAVCVIPSFRRYPAANAREMAQDVAGAVAWTVANVKTYGGDPKRIVLVGHSSGAHLAALVALDPAYLAREGLTPASLHAVLLLSGIYDVRNQGDPDDRNALFGATESARWNLSPLSHATAAAPPATAVCAQHDLPGKCEAAQALTKALAAAGAPARFIQLANGDHYGEPRQLADPDDPLNAALFELLR